MMKVCFWADVSFSCVGEMQVRSNASEMKRCVEGNLKHFRLEVKIIDLVSYGAEYGSMSGR